MNSRGAGSPSSTGWTGGFRLAFGGTVSGALVSDITPPDELLAGLRAPAHGHVFRIMKDNFQMTTVKVTSSRRHVKRSTASREVRPYPSRRLSARRREPLTSLRYHRRRLRALPPARLLPSGRGYLPRLPRPPPPSPAP